MDFAKYGFVSKKFKNHLFQKIESVRYSIDLQSTIHVEIKSSEVVLS
jgi:hypothetical protein